MSRLIFSNYEYSFHIMKSGIGLKRTLKAAVTEIDLGYKTRIEI